MTIPDESVWQRVEQIAAELEGLDPHEAGRRVDALQAQGEPTSILSLVLGWLSLPAPAPLLGAGDVVGGRYTLRSKLGEGGMGTVWRATQQMIARDVAVKIIQPALITPALRERFSREMEMLGQLEHPGIVRIFDAGLHEHDGTVIPFFAMECVEGVPLSTWAAAHRTDRARLLRAMSEVCAAVQHAHDRRIVHRDLKPSNIMMRPDGQPVVLDFGIARLAGGEEEAPGLFSGTPHYAAPEQHLGRDRDFRSGESVDVYAAGAILFEVLAGRRLFEFPRGTPISEMRRRIIEGPPPRLAQVLADCPAPLDDLTARAVRRDPADRYFSIALLSRALARISNRLYGPPQPPAPLWVPAAGLMVPETNWQLTEKLGEGGTGQVWLATHETLPERRVFKFCDSEEKVRTLKRELSLFRLLKERVGRNPHFITLHEVALEEPPWYLMMDHVKAQNLPAWCAQQLGGLVGLPLELKVELIAQAAEALQAAHEAGILHRDIKPDNLLVRSSGAGTLTAASEAATHPAASTGLPHVFVADFGIGQIIADEFLREGATGFTFTLTDVRRSTLSGTMLYLAPEVLEGNPASARSDLYSLGVMLWQLLVGNFHAALDPVNWPARIADPLLRQDLDRCLAGNPSQRWPSAGDLAASLRALPARRDAETRRQVEISARERAAYRRGVIRTAAVAVAVVLALASAGWYAFDSSIVAAAAEANGKRKALTAVLSELGKLSLDPRSDRGPTAVDIIRRIALHTDEDRRSVAENYLPILERDDWQMQEHLRTSPTREAALDSSGGFAIRRDAAGRIEFWDLTQPHPLWQRTGSSAPPVFAVAPGGKKVALAEGQNVLILEGATGTEIGRTIADSAVESIAWRPDGRQLALGRVTSDGLGIIDLAGEPRWAIHGHLSKADENPQSRRPSGLAYSPDGSLLAHWSSESLHLLLWDVEGAQLAAYGFHPAPVRTAVWAGSPSPRSQPVLYSAAEDAFIYGWAVAKNLNAPEPLEVAAIRFPIRGTERQGNSCAWTHLAALEAGRFLAATDLAGKTVCFDVSSGSVAAELTGRTPVVALGPFGAGARTWTVDGAAMEFHRRRSPVTQIIHSLHTGPIEDFDILPRGRACVYAGPSGVAILQGDTELVPQMRAPRTGQWTEILLAHCRGARFLDENTIVCSDAVSDRTLYLKDGAVKLGPAPKGGGFLESVTATGRPACLAFDATRQQVVTGRAKAVDWAPVTGPGRSFRCADGAAPEAVAITPSGTAIAWADATGHAYVCLAAPAEPRPLPVESATTVSFLGDRWLAIGSKTGTRIFETYTLVEQSIADLELRTITELAAQQQGPFAAAAARDGGILLGRLEAGDRLRWHPLVRLGARPAETFSRVRFAGRDRWIGAITSDGRLQWWDLAACLRALADVSCLPSEFPVPAAAAVAP